MRQTARPSRRQFLTSTAAAAGVMGFGLPARAQDSLGASLIVPSPVADVGWSRSLFAGLEAAAAAVGGVTTTSIDSINEGPDADRILQKTVSDGNHFVIAGSFGYMNSALQLARRFPNISVLHASGYQTAPNMSCFAARNYQGTYLMGMAAAALTKSKKLGSVGAFAIPELIASVNAFAQGARSIDPEIEVTIVWVNSWFDPAKEQDAAKALIAQGADVIFSNAQDTPSVVATCEEAGVYSCNLNSSMKAYAPTKYLGVVGTDWTPYFTAEIEAHKTGTFVGRAHFLGIAEGVIKCADWNADIPAEAMAAILAAEGAIGTGTLDPFAGPLLKQDGSEAAAAGAALSDEQVIGMDWHVAGIATPLPQ